MQKLLMISLLCGSAVSLTGCAGMLQNFPGMGPPAAVTVICEHGLTSILLYVGEAIGHAAKAVSSGSTA